MKAYTARDIEVMGARMAVADGGSSLRAGAARVVITPPIGVELAGYGFGPSEGVLAELEAQALVLESGVETVAIVAADLLAVGAEFMAGLRQKAEATLGLAAVHLLVAASHSHSSPTARSLRQWGRVDEGYLGFLETAILEAVGQARRQAVDARLGYGLGRVDTISANRRGAAGPIDPAVPVLCFHASRASPADWNVDEETPAETPVGPLLAVLFNFACHPVSLHSYRNLLSPDYPGYARAGLHALLGPEPVTLFTLGAAGDINPARFYFKRTTPRQARRIGGILGCEAAKVALDPQFVLQPTLRLKSVVVDLPLAPLPAPAELERHHREFTAQAAEAKRAGKPLTETSVLEIQRDWAAEALAAHASGAARQTVPCEITAVRLGPAALVFAPLEVFAATGLAIKAASPAAVTVICTNANGEIGYLPTSDAYDGDDYTNPHGLAPKVYGLYALAEAAEPLFRERAGALLDGLFAE
jgi:neutral ceramidase